VLANVVGILIEGSRGCDLIYANGLYKPERASRAGRGVDPLQHLEPFSVARVQGFVE
jgi:hypothetical protein